MRLIVPIILLVVALLSFLAASFGLSARIDFVTFGYACVTAAFTVGLLPA
jgi:hypothetical protein